MANPVLERRQVSCQFQGAGRPHGMSDKTLGIIKPNVLAVLENIAQGNAFLTVAGAGSGGVSAHDIDVIGGQTPPAQRQIDALGLTLRIGQNEVGSIGIDGVRHDFRNNVGRSSLGVRKPFQNVKARPFGNNDPVSGLIERSPTIRLVKSP